MKSGVIDFASCKLSQLAFSVIMVQHLE